VLAGAAAAGLALAALALFWPRPILRISGGLHAAIVAASAFALVYRWEPLFAVPIAASGIVAGLSFARRV
jgi:hypothetical protein